MQMLPTSGQVQVYSRLIKIGDEYVLEYAQVETINYESLGYALPGGLPPQPASSSSEYYLLVLLLCLVPFLIILAFIYGKRMGQREKGTIRNPKDQALLENLTISQKSTKETSSPTSDREIDEPILSEQFPNLPPSISYSNSKTSSQPEKEEKSCECCLDSKEDNFDREASNKKDSSVQSQSYSEERSQESWRSSIKEDGQKIELVRNTNMDEQNCVNAVISYEIDPSKKSQMKYPVPVKEMIELHKDETQVKNRKVTFGVSTGIENGRLVKKETVETITTYEKDAVDPELNAQSLKRALSNTSQFSQGSIPLSIKAEESSEPSESPIMVHKLSTMSTTVPKSDFENLEIVAPAKLSHQPSLNKSEQQSVLPYIPDASKTLQALLESEDLPDETGKFNKIFKDTELIGEGSFGAVYKVTHRLDSKLYAVKKIHLKLKRYDDLHKRGKVLREVFAISNLQHPNIVRYSTCWVEIESSKRNSRTNSKPSEETSFKKSLLAIKERSSSPYLPRKEITEVAEESSMGFEFEAREEATQQEETIEGEDFDFPEKSKAFREENSISKTLEDKDIGDSNYPMSEMSVNGKSSYLGDYDLYLYIQMEFCAGLNLRNYLDMENREIERTKVLKMFKKLLEGVNAIHKCGILHRDLKPANIFLDNNENVKIGDFGLASLSSSEESTGVQQLNTLNLNLERSHSMMVGTPMYTSPEQEKGKKYNQKTDVYSLGLILYEMLMNFSTSHERYLYFNQLKKENKLPEDFKTKFENESNLILKMTAYSADERPTVEDTIVEVNKLLEEDRLQ